jgi:hypothetical protein
MIFIYLFRWFKTFRIKHCISYLETSLLKKGYTYDLCFCKRIYTFYYIFQRGNPILKHIRNVPWQYGSIVPDYVMGVANCALFLRYDSFKFNNKVYILLHNLKNRECYCTHRGNRHTSIKSLHASCHL